VIDKTGVREMVDTMVLAYATTTSPTPDMKDAVTASVALIGGLKAVRVSAIAWMEYVRANPKHDPEKLAAIQAKLFVDPFDGRAAAKAAEILNAHKATSGVCQKCLSPTKTSIACSKCALHIQKNFRLNDAMIYATAIVLPDVDVLYSYDPGIMAMSHLGSGCTVKVPPNPSGPLFDRISGGTSTAKLISLPTPPAEATGSDQKK